MDYDWSEACDALRDLRDKATRDSERIVELGEKLVTVYPRKLSSELWLVCEQVFVAALDVCRFDLADICLETLEGKFPKSLRVRKLAAMRLEAEGDFQGALESYEAIITEDKTNAAVHKRKIALFKAANKTEDAIRLLTGYLESFMADEEAWLELSDLYIRGMDYNKAAFCLEELILINPFNHLYYERFAEVKYTQGGKTNHEIARQYFAQAVSLSSNTNIRALYGLLLASGSLTGVKQSSKEVSHKQYAKWAGRMISSKYKEVWEGFGNTGKLTPSGDLPQLTASVEQSLQQMKLEDAAI